MSLRYKLLFFTATLILVPVLAILLASGHYADRTRRLSLDAAQKLASADLQHIVAGGLNLAASDQAAVRLQRETAVKNYLRSLADQALTEVDQIHRRQPGAKGWAQIKQALLGVKIGRTGYIFGMDSSGTLTVHPKEEGRNLAKAAHIQEMMRNKEGYIVYHSVTTDRDKAVFYRYYRPLDLIIAPGVFLDEMDTLYDRQAEADLWRKFTALLGAIKVGQNGSVWVLHSAGSEQGRFLLPPAGFDARKPADFPTAEILRDGARTDAGKMVVHRYLVKDGHGGKRALMACIASLPAKGWVIGASLPEAEMEVASRHIAASFGDLKLAVVVTALLAVALAALLALILARRTLAPLKGGVQFARQVSDGDLTAPLPPTDRDEIGDLIGSLATMVEGIGALVRRAQQTSAGLGTIGRRLTSAAEGLQTHASSQSERAGETALAIQEINASIREVDSSVERLTATAAENTASILELSASIEQVAANMRGVTEAGQEVTAAAMETATAARQIAENSRQLDAASAATAAAVGELNAGIRSVEDHAGQVASVSREVLADALSGQQAVAATATGIQDISTSMDDAATAIRALSERAESIGAIVSVIDEVAGAIDLLALNAAIIAAQSGDHGRGFAVVAEEIKELAGRTTTSTREIAEVVHSVQDEIEQAARLVGVTGDRTRTGQRLSVKAGERLEKIVAGVERIAGGMGEIAGAMGEQASASRSISQETETVAAMAGQIVLATGEQEKATGNIQRAAERLKDLAEQVTTATLEQTRTSALIARNTEATNGMIQAIGRASGEQVKGSAMIVRFGEAIETGAQDARQASQVLTESVADLSAEIAVLDEQVTAFRTEAES